jgi:hypothetical protein
MYDDTQSRGFTGALSTLSSLRNACDLKALEEKEAAISARHLLIECRAFSVEMESEASLFWHCDMNHQKIDGLFFLTISNLFAYRESIHI